MPQSLITHCNRARRSVVIPSQRGYVGMESLLALSIVLIVFSLSAAQIGRQVRMQAAVLQKSQVEELRSYVRNRLDCRQTVDHSVALCGTGRTIPLLDVDGAEFLDAEGMTRLGPRADLAMRAYCDDAAPGTLRLEYARLQLAGTSSGMTAASELEFARHPVSGQSEGWRDLFDGVPVVCASTAPPPMSGPSVCGSVVDETVTLNRAQIHAAINASAGTALIAADTGLLGDDFHAELACNLAGYETHTAYVRGSCSARTGIWRWYKSDLDIFSACFGNKQLAAVTCRYRRPCETHCADMSSMRNAQEAIANVSTWNMNIGHAIGGNRSYAGTTAQNPHAGVNSQQVASRLELCRLRGYASVQKYTTSDYSSCGDNLIARFNVASNSWSRHGACAAGNRKIKTLTCADPIPAQCSRRFRVHE